jgi:hypothetical protein
MRVIGKDTEQMIHIQFNNLKTEFDLNKIQNSVHTSQETYYVSITKNNRLLRFRETVAVCCESHRKYTNTEF